MLNSHLPFLLCGCDVIYFHAIADRIGDTDEIVDRTYLHLYSSTSELLFCRILHNDTEKQLELHKHIQKRIPA